MKKIELKVNHIDKNSNSYIENYLMTLGIARENINSFIDKPKNEDEDNPFHLDNINEAVKIAKEICEQRDAKVFVQVDSDCDGYTSSAILIQYLKRRFPNISIQYRLHNGKEHGVIADTIPDDIKLVFIPDAGSNQSEEIQKIITGGAKVIVLDHHEVNTEMASSSINNTIVVNNQISRNFSNKFLSGAGVTYLFCKAMDLTYYKDMISEDYRDLAALGIIADAMNMTSLGNNFISYWGLKNINNKFIKELLLKQSRNSKTIGNNNPTKTDISFYVAPVINGVIRYGTNEDKNMLFKALIENDSTEVITSEYRSTIREENLYEYAVRLSMNAKSRQDNAKKKSFSWICDKIKTEHLDNHNIIIVTLDEKESEKVSANITGLIAMELVKEFNKPCLVLRKTEFDGKIVYGGSGRNGNFYGLLDLKSLLKQSGAFYVEGHASAFGCFLLPEQIDSIVEYFDKQLNPSVFEDTVYQVDYWFHTGETLNRDMLFAFATCGDIWGNGLPRPTFAFDFNFNSAEVQLMGANKDSVKIKHDGVDFVLFKNQEVAKKLQELNSGHIQIVGAPNLNEWMGRQSIQIIIDDIEIEDIVAAPMRSLADLI